MLETIYESLLLMFVIAICWVGGSVIGRTIREAAERWHELMGTHTRG